MECVSVERQLCSEKDVLDFVGICVENDVYLLILYVDVFSEDFFNLKTGLAGMMLQKFTIRFKEMIMGATKGNNFRTFKNIVDAETWISSL
ncbi:DUF4180 domain-containing protein [Bacillus sp. JJ864]|uniref:DUF4180 domain-containing protein n=1 Tax=Bacillus sp. JJ864 TaxID=3122975 RepID=UPI00300012C9